MHIIIFACSGPPTFLDLLLPWLPLWVLSVPLWVPLWILFPLAILLSFALIRFLLRVTLHLVALVFSPE